MAKFSWLSAALVRRATSRIKKQGVPPRRKSTRYDLVTSDGEHLPPKLVITTAAEIAKRKITHSDFTGGSLANGLLMELGFSIYNRETKEYLESTNAKPTLAADDASRISTQLATLFDNADAANLNASDVILGDLEPPPIVPFTASRSTPHVAHKLDIDALAWLNNRERRTNAHERLLQRVIKAAKSLPLGKSTLIDLVVGDDLFIEIKSLSEDVIRQVRGALAQLYHYRFVYRKQYKNPRLLAIFEAEPVANGEHLAGFLSECGIASAWWNAAKKTFDGTATAKRIASWLFAG
jgi:hypothetical protein